MRAEKESAPEGVEAARLQAVYEEYDFQSIRARHWDRNQPGNRAILAERASEIFTILKDEKIVPFHDKQILDFGCGGGSQIEEFFRMGGRQGTVVGVDLLGHRLSHARNRVPDGNFLKMDGQKLAFHDARFDLVFVSTVFSSILGEGALARVAREIDRALKPGGHVLCYDMRYNNPMNRNVRGLSRNRLHSLFPSYTVSVKSLTVVPQIARVLGPLTDRIYPILTRIPVLHSHQLALLKKPNPARQEVL